MALHIRPVTQPNSTVQEKISGAHKRVKTSQLTRVKSWNSSVIWEICYIGGRFFESTTIFLPREPKLQDPKKIYKEKSQGDPGHLLMDHVMKLWVLNRAGLIGL